jgi:hypothetical protein
MIIIILGILLTAKNGNNNVDPDWMETDSFEEKADEAIAMAAKSRGQNTSPSKVNPSILGEIVMCLIYCCLEGFYDWRNFVSICVGDNSIFPQYRTVTRFCIANGFKYSQNSTAATLATSPYP